jgi:rRNA maturation RNase YbeY
MPIDVLFEDVDAFKVDLDVLENDLGEVLSSKGKLFGDIAVVFCSDPYVLEVNKQYLNHDYFTDIITFDYCEGDVVSGDLIVSVDTVASNAELYKSTYSDELFRVVLHGVLHLCGLGDKSNEEVLEMRDAENHFLSSLNNPFV